MTPGETVEGERSVAQVAQTLSRAVRLQRRLALAIVGAIGAAVLAWYYVHLSGAAGAAAAPARAAAGAAIASEMKLPALAAVAPAAHARTGSGGGASRETVDATTGMVDDPAAQGRAAPIDAGLGAPPAAPRQPLPGSSPLRTNSPVLWRQASSDPPPAERDAGAASLEAINRLVLGQPGTAADRMAPPPAGLAEALVPTVTVPVHAAVLGSRRWLLPKGAFLDCTLETAIDSTLPGMATCVLALDVFGADGRVLLLERGTKLVGETRSDARPGQARVAVLWSEARTPTGVVVSLASPATDALGRAGVPGEVDNHFRARFGSAVLLSLIDGAISAAVAANQGSPGVVYNAQGTQSIATEALRNTIGIPPTIKVAPGARIQVLVARDVDFQDVYRLTSRVER